MTTSIDSLTASKRFYSEQCSELRQENERLRASNKDLLKTANSSLELARMMSEKLCELSGPEGDRLPEKAALCDAMAAEGTEYVKLLKLED